MTGRALRAIGLSTPLLLAPPATADFLGLRVVGQDTTGYEDEVALALRFYAVFSDDDGDGIGDGRVTDVGGIPGMEATSTSSTASSTRTPSTRT